MILPGHGPAVTDIAAFERFVAELPGCPQLSTASGVTSFGYTDLDHGVFPFQ